MKSLVGYFYRKCKYFLLISDKRLLSTSIEIWINKNIFHHSFSYINILHILNYSYLYFHFSLKFVGILKWNYSEQFPSCCVLCLLSLTFVIEKKSLLFEKEVWF